MKNLALVSFTLELRSCRRALLPLIILGFAVLTSGCGQTAPPAKPVDIAKDDTCTRCKKPVVDIQYAAEFITKDGFVRKFDDIACMLDHARKVTPAKVAAFYTMDYDKKVWMKAEDAAYVRSQRFKTPNDGGILAFSSKERAQALATQYQAESVSFGDLLK